MRTFNGNASRNLSTPVDGIAYSERPTVNIRRPTTPPPITAAKVNDAPSSIIARLMCVDVSGTSMICVACEGGAR